MLLDRGRSLQLPNCYCSIVVLPDAADEVRLRLHDVPIEDTGRIGLWCYVLLNGEGRLVTGAFGEMLPKRDRSIIILPQNTSLAVITKVTGCHDVPTGINGLRNIKLAARVGHNAPAVGAASHLPDRHRTVVVPPQDIVCAGASKIRHSYRCPRR